MGKKILLAGCPGDILSLMSQKELVLEAIQELPDDASIDQIADRVEFIAAIQKGISEIDRGHTVPHEEVKRQLAAWLTE
jgi:predicted transcriptional regulator